MKNLLLGTLLMLATTAFSQTDIYLDIGEGEGVVPPRAILSSFSPTFFWRSFAAAFSSCYGNLIEVSWRRCFVFGGVCS